MGCVRKAITRRSSGAVLPFCSALVTGAVNREKLMDFPYLDFSKTFNPVFHFVFKSTLLRYVLNN